MHAFRSILMAGLLGCIPAIGVSQTPPPVAQNAVPQNAVASSAQVAAATFRVLDQDRLFRGSVLGQRILAEIRAAEAALEAENQTLFDQLAAEERALTDARTTLPPEDFRARADAFDARVEAIRAERAARSLELSQQSDAAAQRFFDTALPVLVQMMNETGIQALLKPEVMILGPDWLDVTPEAIARLDASAASSDEAPPTGN